MATTPIVRWLSTTEDHLRAHGLTGRDAYAVVCRALAQEAGVPAELWIDGPAHPSPLQVAPPPHGGPLDALGLAYEHFFPELFKAEHGQFFTPRPLAALVVALTEVRPGDAVLDPTCGAGTFLTLAAEAGAGEVRGIEVDPELVALCRVNLARAGAAPTAVTRADLFASHRSSHPENNHYDVIVANPPFSIQIRRPEVLAHYDLARGQVRTVSDALFMEVAHARLRPGGRLGVVLPWSIVADRSFAGLRTWVDQRFVRRAVVGLPEGVFRPFGGAAGRAAVVVLEKRPATERPWIAVQVEHLGYNPRRKRYVATSPDGLRALAQHPGRAPTRPAGTPDWLPAASSHGIAAGRPTARLGELAPVVRHTVHPAKTPQAQFTEIDLADVDKSTGEVTRARQRAGATLRGQKVALPEGSVAVARMRPALNNVAIITRPDPALPSTLVGSAEWVPLMPEAHPHFALLAARSSFTRTQLSQTGGQTRPRTSPQAIAAAEIPLPTEATRARLDRALHAAHTQRLAARQRLDRIAQAYEDWGSGLIEEVDLIEILEE